MPAVDGADLSSSTMLLLEEVRSWGLTDFFSCEFRILADRLPLPRGLFPSHIPYNITISPKIKATKEIPRKTKNLKYLNNLVVEDIMHSKEHVDNIPKSTQRSTVCNIV